ncbi:MAG: PAS domain-containing protein [Oscillospiraceae bacterium]|nr:PAS domain-containing protein [Oscillospiraceae bacterium]
MDRFYTYEGQNKRDIFTMSADNTNVAFSDTDRAVLNSYVSIIDGLSVYLGEGFEIVLHSLENLDHSVIKIVNGNHTNRSAGAPITNLALSMLNEITSGKGNYSYASYRAVNSEGEPLRSTTMLIHGEHGHIIGMLCINFYINTPLSQLLALLGGQSEVYQESFINEDFSGNVDDMLTRSVRQASAAIDANRTVLPANRNREIIYLLHSWGVFQIKDAVVKVASTMGISKNTVYLHLRHIKGK